MGSKSKVCVGQIYKILVIRAVDLVAKAFRIVQILKALQPHCGLKIILKTNLTFWWTTLYLNFEVT